MTFALWATFSDQSRGRMLPEEQDPIRPVFLSLIHIYRRFSQWHL